MEDMYPKTKEESKIYQQMLDMLADQFYHQAGDNITVNRMFLAEMLTKQTMHGIELGKETSGASAPTTTDLPN